MNGSYLGKKKFGRKATEDMKSMSNIDEVMDSKVVMIGEILFLQIVQLFL